MSPLIWLTIFALLAPSCVWGLCSEEFTGPFLDQHNIFRMRHGSPNLTYSAEISAFAQEWADSNLAGRSMVHRLVAQPYGENLFSSWDPNKKPLDPRVVVAVWYNEISRYEQYFGKGEPDMTNYRQWAHFTTMVWKDSLLVGVGCATSADLEWIYIVTNYAPMGNIVGAFQWNVLPPIVVSTTITTTTTTTTTTSKPVPVVNPVADSVVSPVANPVAKPALAVRPFRLSPTTSTESTTNPTINPTINPTTNPTPNPQTNPTSSGAPTPVTMPTFNPSSNPTTNPPTTTQVPTATSKKQKCKCKKFNSISGFGFAMR